MASHERARKAAQDALTEAEKELNRRQDLLSLSEAAVTEFRQRLIAIGLPENAELKEISEQYQALTAIINVARDDLRIIDTLKLNDGLARALRAEAEMKEANSRAERKLGLARRADNRAQALHDAARRAAGESNTVHPGVTSWYGAEAGQTTLPPSPSTSTPRASLP